MPNWARASQSANIMGTRSSAARYDRRIDLPRALPLWPHEIADDSVCGRKKIVAKLARALRAERRRGLAGHWTYDLARHSELLRVYRLELAACRQMQPQSQFKSSMLKMSDGGITRPKAMRTATATTINASSARNCSALNRSE
jgi:hypothetical protein